MKAELDAWALSDLVKAAPDAEPVAVSRTFLSTSNEIRLWAARNETAAFQILLRPRKIEEAANSEEETADEAELWIESTDLTGPATIEKSAFRIYRQVFIHQQRFAPWYVLHTTRRAKPRSFPDPLIPIHPDQRFKIHANKLLALWVDVSVPKDAPAGRYEGRIRVESDNPRMRREFSVTLTVWNFALPDQPALPAMGTVHLTRILQDHMDIKGGGLVPPGSLRPGSKFGDRGRLIIDEYFQMAHRHRLSLWPAGLRPNLTAGLGGNARVRFDDYDSLIMPYVTGRGYADQVPPAFWPVPLDERFPDPHDFGGVRGAAFGKLLRSYTANVRRHFESRDWTARGVIILPGAANGLGLDTQQLRLAAGWIRQEAGKLKTVGRWAPNDPAAYGITGTSWENLGDAVDIWTPDIRLADPALVDERTGLWLRPTAAPFLGSGEICGDALDILTWAWAAWRMRAGGLWCFGEWTLGPTSAVGEFDPKSPNGWFYNGAAYGATGVLASVRLKLLRRAQQDFTYLALLRRFGAGKLADRFASTVLYAAGTQAHGDNLLDGQLDGWSRDRQLWQRTRHMMGRTLAVLANAEPAGGATAEQILAGRTDLQLAHRMLFRQREAVSLRPLAARIQRIKGPAGLRWRIDVPVVVYNRRTTPLSGRLRPGKLSDDLIPLTRSADVVHLMPGESVRVSLSLAAARLPAPLDGKLDIPLRFAVRNGRIIETSAPLTLLRCGRFAKNTPPKIDGDLNDWPTLSANTAGKFEIIGSRSVPKQYASDGRSAALGTLTTVCRDKDALYLAFACRGQDVRRLVEPSRNFAQYDGLIPWGQDATVTLINPRRDPADTRLPRCLLVLPSGAIQATRGIPSRPATQRTRAWPCNAKVATMKLERENVWWVEVRIGFEAFGGPPKNGEVWSINFARIDGKHGEVSTWSGPARYPTATSGMGNLIFGGEDDD